MPTKDKEIAQLRREVNALKQTLGTLIAWLPQSANAPIRVDEAEKLLAMLPRPSQEPTAPEEPQ